MQVIHSICHCHFSKLDYTCCIYYSLYHKCIILKSLFSCSEWFLLILNLISDIMFNNYEYIQVYGKWVCYLCVFSFNLLDVVCRILWLSVQVEKVLVLPYTCVHVYWMHTFSAAKHFRWTLHSCKLHGSQWSKQYVMAHI